MSDPFLGEIAVVAFSYAPNGWALCNGQLMPISQNSALFSLLGTTYGGDGRATFALPNLQGSIPVHPGQVPGSENRFLGEQAGSPSVTLTTIEMPVHTHPLKATAALGTSTKPDGRSIAVPRYGRVTENWFAQPGGAGQATMDFTAASQAGAGYPHNNLPPYLALTFVIALQGVFPQRP